MARALETIVSGFKLTRLQAEAIKRIHEYQAELKQYGIYLRSGMELEFMVEDRFGRLLTHTLNLQKAEEYLRDPKQNLPLLGEFKTDPTSEYEVTAGDMPDQNGKLNPAIFSPVAVASTIARLKKHTLSDMLQQSTCLSSDIRGGVAPYTPVFRARPIIGAHEGSPWNLEDRVSSLHINVSFYNKAGENLFTKHPDLIKHCARSLVQLQHEAGLAMLPKKHSLKRFWSDQHSSVPNGLGMETADDDGKKTYSSVNMRGGIFEYKDKDARIKYHHETRIENRLPGADADPFVSMAVTMAAMVDAVRKNVTRTEDKSNKKMGIKVSRMVEMLPQYGMAESRDELVEQFTSGRHVPQLRLLLGDDFYDKILERYGSPQLARSV